MKKKTKYVKMSIDKHIHDWVEIWCKVPEDWDEDVVSVLDELDDKDWENGNCDIESGIMEEGKPPKGAKVLDLT